jgi:uncharacterized protein YyaL (SSP411 family)
MNHLSSSTSPYLLQHAHNPVDWYPWSEDALAKARAEDKPIFLSIGYAACHWCHVMAHESFEDKTTAALMNENFICIKVDREERPDLDGIYMAAVVALTGSGGWPMSVFLTPDLVPFYGGTYFPPVPRHNLPAFRDVLTSIAEAWTRRRGEIERVGGQLVQHIQSQSTSHTGADFTPEHLAAAEKNLLDSYDWGYGGWGVAPKFPQAMTIEFLLARNLAPVPSPKGGGEQVALHALQAMARGGMYDVVGGGFSRYSTDNFWRVPHFEKMLYDNALLVRAYLHAWQITGNPSFRRVAEETLDFVAREMTHPDGGFYSSLDADSEGEEGKFYVWTKEEIRETLVESSEFFETAYGITDKGNASTGSVQRWEGRTVLQRALDDSTLAARFDLTEQAVPVKLAECHAKLLAVRGRRVRPATDDKIITAWNGLMLAAFAEAARVLPSTAKPALAPGASVASPEGAKQSAGGIASSLTAFAPRNDGCYKLATRSAEFLLTALRPDGKLRRAWREGKTTDEVFLEDYAALILGLLDLYQTDFDNKWFTSALELAEEMIQRFSDPAGGFFDTPADGEALLVRPKDLQDNATPSGNSLAVEALLKLSALTGRGDFRDQAERALRLVVEPAARYPTAFAHWLSAAEFAGAKVKQVAIILSEAGQDAGRGLVDALRAGYRPNVVAAAALHPVKDDAPDLLRDRSLVDGKSAAYVCEGFVCQRPVTRPDELKQLL